MELSDHDCEILKRLEEELWREETRFDIRRMDEVLAEDFFEFDGPVASTEEGQSATGHQALECRSGCVDVRTDQEATRWLVS